ncbi:MAG: phage major capsid protein [Gammaproteobacteria bacterium]
MASVTLVESAKLALNQLIAGVIENVITVDQMFEVIPFDGIDGNALQYSREAVLGDVETSAVDATITATAAATFTSVTSSLTTIIGNAEVNGLIQATRSGSGNDQTAIQIASKAKSAGRKWRELFITGDGTGDDFTGISALCAAGQTITPSTNGDALTFDILDNLIDLILDKDGQVDYFLMAGRTRRAYFALLRALGGAGIGEVVTLPSGAEVAAYRGVGVFRNENIPINQTQGSSNDATEVFAGTLDDGSRQHGFAGLTAQNAAGIMVEDVGIAEAKDNRIWRVKWYSGLALFSELGLACAPGIIP